MKIIFSYLITSLFCSSLVHAQAVKTAMFETTVWFEDAVGNRDSIVIGNDTLANNTYNPDFGELDIKAPFDSIFEVRASHWLSYRYKTYMLSKKVIDTSGFRGCYGGVGVLCFVKAKHQSITIYWDQPVFASDPCLSASFMTPNLRWELVNPFELDWTKIRSVCMPKNDRYVIYLDNGHIPSNEVLYLITHPKSNKMEVDSLTGILISMTSDNWFVPVCAISSIGSPPWVFAPHMIAPNPAFDHVTIGDTQGPTPWSVQILSSEGAVLRQATQPVESTTNFDIGNLPAGVYFVLERFKDGRSRTGRFVKE